MMRQMCDVISRRCYCYGCRTRWVGPTMYLSAWAFAYLMFWMIG